MSVTIVILLITCAVSLLTFSNREYFYRFQYNPFLVKHNGQWYRIFSHALIHGDYMHLIFNMMVLYMFGRQLEWQFEAIFGSKGSLIFIGMYIIGILGASLPAYFKHQDNEYYNSVGASGAVSALVFSFILFNPLTKMGILFIPFIRIPAFLFGFLYLFFEAYLDKRGGSRIAHDAHIWGALIGLLYTIITYPQAAIIFKDSVNAYINNFF